MNRREFFSTIAAGAAGAVGARVVRRTPPCDPAALEFIDSGNYKWEVTDGTVVFSDAVRDEVTRVLVDSLEAW